MSAAKSLKVLICLCGCVVSRVSQPLVVNVILSEVVLHCERAGTLLITMACTEVKVVLLQVTVGNQAQE